MILVLESYRGSLVLGGRSEWALETEPDMDFDILLCLDSIETGGQDLTKKLDKMFGMTACGLHIELSQNKAGGFKRKQR